MKTLHPVDEATNARIGKAYLICSQYPEVFGDVTMKKFCSMFVDVLDEDEDLIEARKKAYAGDMYALLYSAFGGTMSFDKLTRIGDCARDLLARIDGEEATGDE